MKTLAVALLAALTTLAADVSIVQLSSSTNVPSFLYIANNVSEAEIAFPYTLDSLNGVTPTNFFDVTFKGNGDLICHMQLSTNTVQSRLTDLPTLLCTITNRVLLVSTKTATNVVTLERIGVGCVEVPVPPPAQWHSFTVPVFDTLH